MEIQQHVCKHFLPHQSWMDGWLGYKKKREYCIFSSINIVPNKDVEKYEAPAVPLPILINVIYPKSSTHHLVGSTELPQHHPQKNGGFMTMTTRNKTSTLHQVLNIVTSPRTHRNEIHTKDTASSTRTDVHTTCFGVITAVLPHDVCIPDTHTTIYPTTETKACTQLNTCPSSFHSMSKKNRFPFQKTVTLSHHGLRQQED